MDAKRFVESAPVVIVEDISIDKAKNYKKKINDAGGEVEIIEVAAKKN